MNTNTHTCQFTTLRKEEALHKGLARSSFKRSTWQYLRVILASISCAFFSYNTEAAVINGVDFTTVYDASTLPDAAATPWALKGGNGSASVSDGILTLESTTAETRYYQIEYNAANPVWNGSTEGEAPGTTIEFSMQVISTHPAATVGATTVFLSTGKKAYYFFFYETKIEVGNGPGEYAFDTVSDFNTYRIVLTGGANSEAFLYINNSPIAALSNVAGSTVTNNHIYFGDAGTRTGGEVAWDYVAFTNAGAFAPIPEPSTTALAAGGVLLLGYRYRRVVGRKTINSFFSMS